MLKLIFITALLFIGVINLKAQGSGVYLKDQDSIGYNEFVASDLIGALKYVTGDYRWHRTSWYALSFGIRNFMQGKANTWGKTNTFNDPVYLNDFTYCYIMTPFSSTFYSTLGSSDKPYKYGYIINLFIGDPTDTSQRGSITYDGSDFIVSDSFMPSDSSVKDIGSPAKPFKAVNADSVKSNVRLVLNAPYGVEAGGIFQWEPQLNVPVTADDSSLIVTSNFIELAPTDTITIDTLYIDPDLMMYTPGIEILIYNKTTNPVTFKRTGGAGYTNCMRMETDVVLNQFDSFKLIYYLDQQRWLQSGPFINND